MKKSKLKKPLTTTGIIILVLGLLILGFSFANFASIITDKEIYTAGDTIGFVLTEKIIPFEDEGIYRCSEASAQVILIEHTTERNIFFLSGRFVLNEEQNSNPYKQKSFLGNLNQDIFDKDSGYDIEARFVCLDKGVEPISKTSYNSVRVLPRQACKSNTERRCVGDKIYWYNSCGSRGDIYKSCSSNQYCSDAQCITKQPECTSKKYKECDNNQVYWFDSCGKKEELVVACTSSQYCADGQCLVKEEEQEEEKTCGDQPEPPCAEASWEAYPYCQWNMESCPLQCTEDIMQSCADGSSITEHTCTAGELSKTSQECPAVFCTADTDCKKGYACVEKADGTNICKYSSVDVQKEFFDEETKKIMRIGGGVVAGLGALLLILALFI